MIKKYWKRITGSGTMMSWAHNIIGFMHGIVVTPLLLLKFDDTALSYYYLLQTLLGLGLLADAGFGHTLQRSVAFFHAGIARLPRNKDEYANVGKVGEKPNYDGLTRLLTTTNSIYLILLSVMMILLTIAGLLTLWNVLTIASFPTEYLIAFGLMLLNTGFALLRVKWSSFMMGFNKVAELNQILTVSAAVRLVFFFIILLSGLGIVGVMTYVAIESILLFIIIRYQIMNWFKSRGIRIGNPFAFDKELFRSLWGVSWKSGLNTFGYFFVSQGSSLIIGQLKDTTQMANFLFTQKILTFIKGIAQAPFFAHTPKYYGLMAKKEYQIVKNEAKGNIFLSISTLIIGLIAFGLLGSYLLEMVGIDNRVVNWQVYLLLSAIIILDMHALMHGTLYISTNSVPFLIPGLITGAVITGLGIVIAPIYGIIGVVAVQFLGNLAWNNWYAPYLSLRLINWNLRDYIYSISIGGAKYWHKRFINR